MKLFIVAAAASFVVTATALRAEGPTDPQIADIVVTANQVDIDAGRLAAKKTTRKDIKALAEQMVTDHSGVNKQATELVTRLKVTPEDNPTSQSLKSEGDKNIASLKNLKGAEFDKAYVDHEVAYHQQVLDAIDQALIPNAKNVELKTLLEKVRPAIAAHLAHAKHVQAALEGK